MATVCENVDSWIEANLEVPLRRMRRTCAGLFVLFRPFCWAAYILFALWVYLTKITLRIFCEVLRIALNIAAAIANVLLLIPIIGPLYRALVRIWSTVWGYVVGLADGLLFALGLKITKQLRVHVVPLGLAGIPLAEEAHLRKILTETAAIFHKRARIHLDITFEAPILDAPESATRIGTEGHLVADELWLKGTWHHAQTIRLFDSNFASLVGIGAPVIVYILQEVGYDGSGNVIGCSAGPFADWIAVEAGWVVESVCNDGTGRPFPLPAGTPSASVAPISNPNYQRFVIAHELCHALGLLGHANSSGTDLMVPGRIIGDYLSPFQVGIIRSSPHVTFI